MRKSTTLSRIIAGGMLRSNTPVEDYTKQYGLWVKREDRACLKPGPPFSKTRGVYARVASRPEDLIGVLDTYHSQAGHAVARACQILGKQCINYYPEFKHEPGPRYPQLEAQKLGATLQGIPAGRSAILFHQAKRLCEAKGGYMMPNALKLEESVEETAKEVPTKQRFDWVIIPSSSGTIAAGVIKGFSRLATKQPRYIVHLGYTRSEEQVRKYLALMSGVSDFYCDVIDEGYQYKDVAKGEIKPPWPCNPWYDLKSFHWWLANRTKPKYKGNVLFWNIG